MFRLEIKSIKVVKEGRDVEQWGSGWVVEVTFPHPRIKDKEMHRAFNKIDDKMIDNDNMVLKAIQQLVNLQSEWLAEQEKLDAKA